MATYALSKEDAKSGIARALELFPELEKRWKITCRLLSGGEQQMVVLAQALVSHPRVILVDELSLGLAPVVVKRLAPVLQAIAATGVGVLLIEQFAHVALGLAKKAYVLEGGRIRYEGTARELTEQPDLLRSAYLLRGKTAGSIDTAAPHDGSARRTPRADQPGTSTARPVISPSLSFASTSLTESSGCTSVFSTRRPAAWSCMTSQRSSQVPTRLPATVCSLPTNAGRGHADHAAEADDRVGAAAGEHRHRVGVRLVGADEVEHEVGAPAARQLAHRVDRPPAFEHVVGAELRRQRPTPGVGVDGDGCRPIRARGAAAARCGRRRRRRSRRRSCPAWRDA